MSQTTPPPHWERQSSNRAGGREKLKLQTRFSLARIHTHTRSCSWALVERRQWVGVRGRGRVWVCIRIRVRFGIWVRTRVRARARVRVRVWV